MISVIITHHKTPELLYLCIKSIKENFSGNAEIIVTDSESEKETEKNIKEKFPEIKFLAFKKNLGYSKIVNRGIKKSKGKYILILNADIVILKNSIETLTRFLDSHPKTAIAAPQLVDFNNNTQVSCFKDPKPKYILIRRTPLKKTKKGKEILKEYSVKPKKPTSVDWAQGSALMVRKEFIKEVGLLDENFFMYFEDADWCKRFRDKGYDIMHVPKAKMAHYYHRKSKKWGALLDILLNKYTRIHIKSAIRYFIKHSKK
ncbi:MAG: glycosyltransferase [Candidatus Portnoybacteria bacterium]|nr:glycosyltransferase [Candidatus Portnoybacteria bacterium]